MQYSLPQFVEVEDTIIGPLTLKQFLILVGGGLIVFLFYSIFSLSIIFFVLSIPTGGAFAILAFGKFNGRPMLKNLPMAIDFLRRPKVRIWKRTAETGSLKIIKTDLKAGIQTETPKIPVGSRLHKLAYLLDQKTAEEERLIQSGQIKGKWLNQI